MQNSIDFIQDNIQVVYYVTTILGVIYGFYKYMKKNVVKSNIFNLFKLITEVPLTIVEIKEGQKEIFQEIRLQNKFINAILENLELAQFLCDDEGKCIKVNSKWISITGLSESEALGHNWLLSVHYEDRERIQTKWHHMIHENTPFEEVFRYQHRVTSVITKVKCTATDVLDEHGKRIFIIGLSSVI
jgi:PAS domain S-box-containing protein